MANIMRLGGGSGGNQYVWDKYTTGLAPSHTAIEYIESTGTQCIDTGVVAKSGLSMVASLELTSTKESAIAGAYGNSSRFYPLMVNGVSLLYGYGALNTISGISAEIGKKYNVESSLLTGSQTVKVNGETVASASNANSYNTGKTLLLFANNFSDSVSAAIDFAEMKLFSCQIYENGTLVRDFAPCKNANGEVGLYDLVNGVFYGNTGSGAFVAGEEYKGEFLGQVKSADVNAYPFYGVQDGYYYEAVGETLPITQNGLCDVRQYVAANVNIPIPSATPVLLWTNARPTSAFTPQTLTFDESGFSGYLVEIRYSTSVDTRWVGFIPIGTTMGVDKGVYGYAGTSYVSRYCGQGTGNSITINEGKIATSRNDIYAVPTRIWGVKFTL